MPTPVYASSSAISANHETDLSYLSMWAAFEFCIVVRIALKFLLFCLGVSLLQTLSKISAAADGFHSCIPEHFNKSLLCHEVKILCVGSVGLHVWC